VGYIFNAITLIITRKLPVYFIIIITTVNLFYFFTNTFVVPLPGSYLLLNKTDVIYCLFGLSQLLFS
jgi:hypothetical protein